MDVNLEHILVSAKLRRASLTPETAGYLTLAVADALLTHPCRPGPRHVSLSEDGTVSVDRAPAAANEHDAVMATRTLLGYLLSVCSGATPALTACSQRTEPTSLQSFVRELESSLIPVNRGAGKRALARLAREASRVKLPAGVRWTPPSAPKPRRSAPPAQPAEVTTSPNAADDVEFAPTTEVDAAVAPAPTPEPRVGDVTTDSTADAQPTSPVAFQAPQASSNDEAKDERAEPEDEPPLETYEPPAVAGDDPILDELTASPPEVALDSPLDEQPPADEEPRADKTTTSSAPSGDREQGQTEQRPTPRDRIVDQPSHPSTQRSAKTSRPRDPSSETAANDTPSSEPSGDEAQGKDRVEELLAQMEPVRPRSTKQLSHELKSMLGLPPTPPPADVEDQDDEQGPEQAAKTETQETAPRPATATDEASVERRRRNLSLTIKIVLLIVALAVAVAVYLKYPQLLMSP